MQSWLTHFAVAIEIECRKNGQRDVWLLDRGKEGLNFRKLPSCFQWENFTHCDVFYGLRGSSPMLSSVPPWINEFGVTDETTRQKVWDFLNEQSGYPYNIVNKNCQHFAYDFFRYKLKNEWLQMVVEVSISMLLLRYFSKDGLRTAAGR
jgi:hypothetical protein